MAGAFARGVGRSTSEGRHIRGLTAPASRFRVDGTSFGTPDCSSPAAPRGSLAKDPFAEERIETRVRRWLPALARDRSSAEKPLAFTGPERRDEGPRENGVTERG